MTRVLSLVESSPSKRVDLNTDVFLHPTLVLHLILTVPNLSSLFPNPTPVSGPLVVTNPPPSSGLSPVLGSQTLSQTLSSSSLLFPGGPLTPRAPSTSCLTPRSLKGHVFRGDPRTPLRLRTKSPRPRPDSKTHLDHHGYDDLVPNATRFTPEVHSSDLSPTSRSTRRTTETPRNGLPERRDSESKGYTSDQIRANGKP